MLFDRLLAGLIGERDSSGVPATKSATLVISPGEGQTGPNGQDAEMEEVFTVQ